MTLEELRRNRQELVEVLRKNGSEAGFKRLLTDLYPDNAHFIYELLQNAEDAKASEVRFVLKADGVEFEHNGDRLFLIEDVSSITNIGDSPKKDDPTNIGKFGIGFKAVFAYTSTPEITSGKYHFRIRDLVVPDTNGLTSRTLGEKETRFSFPFDNPAKPPEEAQGEIESNLRQLDESTLLFLSNIRKIEYLLPDSTLGFLERKEADGNRIEILVQHPEESEPASAVFLRFEKTVEVKNENDNLQPCRIAVAFGLEKNQEQGGKQSAKKRGRTPPSQWKIIPLEPGKVCIYFPAEKEMSNLRFHLHAPFASTVARDSVRDCPANDELRDHLADLIAESMTTIRDQGLLTVGFLAVLPNDRDSLPLRYRPIQERLIEVFQNNDLTPMKCGGHAPSNDTYRGRRQLSDLINDKDLAIILGKDLSASLWIANPPQQNQREDNFLSTLGIPEWNTEDLVNGLSNESETMTKWLAEKPDEWHQGLYALLLDYLDVSPQWVAARSKDKVSELRIIRCGDGLYRVGGESYFPSDDGEHDENFPRVAKAVYSSGKNERERERALKFLKDVGVREVNEAERVRMILENRYSRENFQPDIEDIKRFMSLLEKEPGNTDLFGDYFIFQLERQLEDKTCWGRPKDVFLDAPYLDTVLSAFYGSLGETSDRKWALSPNYEEYGIEPEKLGKFAKLVGAQIKLKPRKQHIPAEHPAWNVIPFYDKGGWSKHGKNEDYDIPEFDILLVNPDLNRSKLIWNTVSKLPSEVFHTTYRSNRQHEVRPFGSSTFVLRLRDSEWIPQESEGEITFVKPRQATVDKLPSGFPYEKGQDWLLAISFGENVRRQEESKRLEEQKKTSEFQQREAAAKSLGFDSGEEAEEMAELKRKFPEEFNRFQESCKERPPFPSRPVPNPERRRERLAEQYGAAPEKEYETRERSVRATRVEIDPHTYLKNQYTNDKGQMSCQVCEEEMPFKKRDGEYYFKAVEALSRDYFPKEHEPQFLALCPLCSAKYKEFVKRDEAAMRSLYDALKTSDKPEVPLTLEDAKTYRLRFVEAHWVDMQKILQKSTQSELPEVDQTGTWTEQDQQDFTMASLRYAETRYPEEEIV